MNMPIELIERLNSAAKTAEEIHQADTKRVEELRYHARELQKALREAMRIARKSGIQARKLNAQVWDMAKKQRIISIQYNPDDATSHAIFE